jgi:choline-sulfatase
MLTGREVQRSGGWANESVLQPELPTLPEVFADAGYETALVGKMHLGGNRQFVGFKNRPYGDLTGAAGHQFEPLFESVSIAKGAGKEFYHKFWQGEFNRERVQNAGVTEFRESQLQEQNVLRETLSFLREYTAENSSRPWFVCASFSRPHFPLTAPRRHFERYWPDGVTHPKVGPTGDATDHPLTELLRDRWNADELSERDLLRGRAGYFACVSYLDEILGDLLGSLERDGLLDETIVVYASDHGEMAGEHGMWGKSTWHEGSARIPWYIQLPEQRSGEADARSITTPVSLGDLFPTLCGLAGVEIPNDLDGVDLSESVRTGEEPDRGPVFCDNFLPKQVDANEFRAIRDGKYKYVGFRDAPELLFNLDEDPFEQENLATNPTGEDTEALHRLRRIFKETVDFEEIARKRKQDLEYTKEFSLPIPKGHGNAYLMPDGRLVDAETPLYQPFLLSKEPGYAFDDWPGNIDRDNWVL